MCFGVPVHQLLGGPQRSHIVADAIGLHRRKAQDQTRYLAEEAACHVGEWFSAVSSSSASVSRRMPPRQTSCARGGQADCVGDGGREPRL